MRMFVPGSRSDLRRLVAGLADDSLGLVSGIPDHLHGPLKCLVGFHTRRRRRSAPPAAGQR